MSFPPSSKRHDELERLVPVYATISAGRRVVYLSAPLTTGRRLAKWRLTVAERGLKDQDRPHEFRHQVFEANRAEAAGAAERLRSKLQVPVIDPTALVDQPGWVQDDYRAFWALVIERFCDRVVFMDGWAASDGCSYEFLVAAQSGAQTFDIFLKPIAIRSGVQAIQAGIEDRRAHGQDAAFALHVLGALGEITPTTFAR